jgi:7-cyano-7-deazaguanine reductase
MPKDSPLGQNTYYAEMYSPHLLYPVPRTLSRDKIGISDTLPFQGVDIWNAFEISWLNSKGKPEVALAEFSFPCTSPNIVESKSFKLYLISFSQAKFDSYESVKQTLEKDLSDVINAPATVVLYPHSHFPQRALTEFTGTCIDDIDVEIDTYLVEPKFLETHSEKVQETVYSNLFKSNCLVTGQPDWGSVSIHYSGNQIDHVGLLKFLISFRNHSGFAEHCVEQIFTYLMDHCKPELLTVYARYTRRGGLDINPFRSNFEQITVNDRHIRQ